ncbi:hypothetical protein HJC23_011997 [Cyclotella cryptica]|uniref:S1 motif domain-containing protein n=1 Tax=Cyclotella cryptica TaxID=29204 RepID=A0ABD3QQQ4_9STRA
MNRTAHHPQHHHRHHHHPPPPPPPPLHSIHRGIVTRLTPYGCFVRLLHSPHSGLVHISQLHPTKVDDVRNVVDVEGEVYVKVMEVCVDSDRNDNVDDDGDGGGEGRSKHNRPRIKLSMKYVDQENGMDLDPDHSKMEQDLFHSGRRGGIGGGGDSRGERGGGGGGGVDTLLGRALSSNIGMSCAMDPGNLILRGKVSGGAGGADGSDVVFNGYSLVGEEEGEAEDVMYERANEKEEQAFHRNNNNNNNNNKDMGVAETKMVRPMGRGRGTTLPAWMTRGDADDRLGTLDRSKHIHRKGDGNDSEEEDADSRRRRKGSKHGRKDKRHKHHKRREKHDRHEEDRRRRRDRSPSYSYSSSVRSESPSPSRERKRAHRKRNDSSRKRYKERRSSRSPSRERNSKANNSEFASVEEAKAVMERLERRRRER